MPGYAPPINETTFVLDEIVELKKLGHLAGFDKASPELVQAILEEGGRFAAEVLHPLNAVGDVYGCVRNDDGSITVPPGFQAAFDQFVAGGWTTLQVPEDLGGQGLPIAVGNAVSEYFIAANHALEMYHGLTAAAVLAVNAMGSEALCSKYLPKMVSGHWTGTMNLTEPQCGTDLGLVRTLAAPQADGSYRVTGTKIFISGGEHDMAENIIHLVLARLPDAPAGTRGISLLLVPRLMVGDDGTIGDRNTLSCGSIEHKMGVKGSCTCVMNFDGATGWLVGEPHRGLAAMFIMMNHARLGVGLQGLAQADGAYQTAVRYAMERRQGRALTGPAEPDEPADTLFVHPDVRRMLMECKALTEGLRALMLWGALQVDLAHLAPGEEARQVADDLVGLLTPVIKGYGTDKGFDVTVLAQQVLGGHGYISEWGIEQRVRDVRITQLYEGTNGVQAMDLVGRKLPRENGRAIQAFMALVAGETGAAGDDAELAPIAKALDLSLADLKDATLWLARNAEANPNHAGAAAYAYMYLLGIVATGLMWLRMARAAQARLAAGEGDASFMQAKLVTARYFSERIMPETCALRRKIESGADSMMALSPEAFSSVSGAG